MEHRIYLNDDWYFSKEYHDSMHQFDFDESQLTAIRLPHTTQETPFHYFDEAVYQSVSAYRRIIIPKKHWRGRHVLLTVEAAAHVLKVYLNGELIGTHQCGYTAFTVDLAKHLDWKNPNVLVLQVDSRETLNIPPFGHVIDYMTYGGLYREVYIDVKRDNYIAGVFAKPQWLGGGKASLECEITRYQPARGKLIQKLYDSRDSLVAVFEQEGVCNRLDQIRPWQLEQPVLYKLVTELYEKDELIDSHQIKIGFREAVFRSDGFYLNGHKVKIRGLNRHQSYPYVGYAMPESVQKMDADLLKNELGLNAVRTSHYPQSHYFIDRCDEIGLLVFTEIPGWQYIGDDDWQQQAVKNTEEMVIQYRNHPSIILWGVRINESPDHDTLYRQTNDTAKKLDPTRQTSGVRCIQNSSLLEDVYAYNDFSHFGPNKGCVPKRKSMKERHKGYLISEYNGHMYPTKSFDSEAHRTEHMLRHARVADAYYGEADIAGGFGWCMSDYNTHKDFGSGDRICYHGVMDMFRNKKLAAYLYQSQDDSEDVLEISSTMDIGEHPGTLMKAVCAVTNADSIRLYKNEQLIKEYQCSETRFKNLPHGPVIIDDFIGDLMAEGEGFPRKKAADIKKILIAASQYGVANLPFSIKLLALKCMVFRGMKMQDAIDLYTKYIGNWGEASTAYRFEAVKNINGLAKVVKTVRKEPMKKVSLKVRVSHTTLIEKSTYDVSAVRISAIDENGNVLPFYHGAVNFETTGEIGLIGPANISLQGGFGGTYVKTMGHEGQGLLRITGNDFVPVEISFMIKRGEK